jgi:poly-gamma-glutamate synthesis protein (capsule biosynthesis protein)
VVQLAQAAAAAGEETSEPVSTVDIATEAATAPVESLVISAGQDLPAELNNIISETLASEPALQLTSAGDDSAALYFDWEPDGGEAIYKETFAVATRFNTIFPTVTLAALQEAWQGDTANYGAVAVLSDTLPALVQVLGPSGPTVSGYAAWDEVAAAAWSEVGTLVLAPFDLLTPNLVVFAIDGQNPVENANRFDSSQYPLVATLYLHRREVLPAPQQAVADALLDAFPEGNRKPDRLTVIAMTGVTAMCRLTAQEMDRRGYEWPAEVVGPELAAADITHISNEVPFVPNCKTNTDTNNLVFCSKPEYMAALTASGVDIIGLTGNHQNDFGRANALVSLEIYEEAGLPIYGGGRNKEAAFAPYYVEHNGNRLAFLGANSYGPGIAWATDDQPGSAPFDLAIMSATIRNIKAQGRAEVVLAELQYQETYDVRPIVDQQQDFNALVAAGADIVTGVQSHVPQAMEFTDGKLIVYGLGNLYFDQMWDQVTREGMIVKHTIYQGRHISTQILTTLLYDYGQPRWTTPEQRSSILKRVFAASFWE